MVATQFRPVSSDFPGFRANSGPEAEQEEQEHDEGRQDDDQQQEEEEEGEQQQQQPQSEKQTPRNPPVAFRRPQTTKSSDFWFVDMNRWNRMLAALDEAGEDKKAKKSALNQIRKYDLVGRLMETNKGALAVVPCQYCARESPLGERCMIDKDVGGSCAFCKRNGRANCTAKLELSPTPPPTARDLDIQALSERVEALEAPSSPTRIQSADKDLMERIAVLENLTADLERSLQSERQKRIELKDQVIDLKHRLRLERQERVREDCQIRALAVTDVDIKVVKRFAAGTEDAQNVGDRLYERFAIVDHTVENSSVEMSE